MAASAAASFAAKLLEVRDFGLNRQLTDDMVNECMSEAFNSFVVMNTRRRSSTTAKSDSRWTLTTRPRRRHPIFILSVLVLVFVSCTLVVFHRPTQKFVSRRAQTLIYPFMRYWRIITLPVQERFPSMRDWHERQCIVYNPLYRNPDLTCWPCERVQAVADLTLFIDFAKSFYLNEAPFIIKNSTANLFSLSILKELYTNNINALDTGTTLFYSLPSFGGNVKAVLNLTTDSSFFPNIHVRWQFRRVSSARVLRQIFRRPFFVPSATEVSLERYIFVDGANSPRYTTPLTEFANVWLTQGSGERPVILLPSPHCETNCKPISTTLHPGTTLFYNWQFWRTTFLPSETDDLSVTYMGSAY